MDRALDFWFLLGDRFGHAPFSLGRRMLAWARLALINVPLLLLGALLGDIVLGLADPDGSHIRYPFSVWMYALLGGLLLAFLLGLLLKRVEGDLSLETSAVYHALDWFYFDMHFGENPADDVRCTIWVPYPRSQDHEIKALRQIVDYIPRKSKTGEKSFRYNKKAGRVFRIYHVVNGRDSRRGDLRCKGILGLCAADALEKGEMKVECVPDGQPFEEYMVRNWNFSAHEARYLTADRRSYLCIPMLTSDKKQLLGIIYCDSRSPTALTQKTGDDAQKYLPMIARTFAGIGRKED